MPLLASFAYATVQQFRTTAVLAKALINVPDDVIQPVLYAKARNINGYLKSQFLLGQSPLPPLIAWGDDIQQLNIDLAVPLVMQIRGLNPQNQDMTVLKDRLVECNRMLYDISKRIYVPDVIDYANPPDVAPSPQAYGMPSSFDVLAPIPYFSRWNR